MPRLDKVFNINGSNVPITVSMEFLSVCIHYYHGNITDSKERLATDGNPHFYRLQTKFAKVMFSQVFVCPRGGGGRGSVQGVSVRETPQYSKEQAARILLQECIPVGCVLPAC